MISSRHQSTTPIKKWLKATFLVFSSILTIQLSAQIPILPTYDTLEVGLNSFYTQKNEAEISEFRFEKKWNWLRYIPSFGYNFVSNSYMIGYNTNDIANALNSKQTIAAKIISIKKHNDLLLKTDLKEIAVELTYIKHQIALYNANTPLVELESQLFDIYTQQYNKAEITPSDYISKKITFESLNISRLSIQYQISERIAALFLKAKLNPPNI